MRCQNCGAEVLDEYVHCHVCGVVIARPRVIGDALIRTPRQNIISAALRRRSTDTIVPYSIVWAYVALSLFELAVTVSLTIHFMTRRDLFYSSILGASEEVTIAGYMVTVASLIGYAIVLYLYYIFVRRQNMHFARERSSRAAIISLVSAAAASHERPYILEGDLWTMKNAHCVVERKRAPWFWVLAAALPLIVSLEMQLRALLDSQLDIGSSLWAFEFAMSMLISLTSLILVFYMYWFLGKEMLEHDLRWRSFSTAARNALLKLGFPCSTHFRTNTLPERNFALYLVLSIFTAGIFMLYWLYALAKDPNDHFKDQWRFEDSLLRVLDSRPAPKP